MKENKLANCYKSYYQIWVHPSRSGDAIVSTCCKNLFRLENRLRIKKGIKDTMAHYYTNLV